MEDHTGRKLDALIAWADENPSFDPKFLFSVKSHYERKGQLSLKQYEALDNIIAKFNIEIEDWLECDS